MDGPTKAVPLAAIKRSAFQKQLHILREVSEKIGAVGLAAPQIGWNAQVYVVTLRPTKYRPYIKEAVTYFVINPEVISWNGDQDSWEGCWSVGIASVFGLIKRPKNLEVRFYDEKAEQVQKLFAGFEACVNAHEIDHFEQTCFLHHSPSKILGEAAYRRMQADKYLPARK